jgi:integrase
MPSSGKKTRSVPLYLSMLEKARKSPITIRRYRDALAGYARYLNVPLDELHRHATAENFIEYLDTPEFKTLAPNTRRAILSAISRYMKLNGTEFDELELAVVRVRAPETRQDKPLSLDTLQKMMDLADTQMKAVIAFLVSTGARAGETSQILLSDARGDVITIRNEIAKNGRGGRVFLNAEAREYLDLWLKERDRWIAEADQKVKNIGRARPKDDGRLFACSYSNISQRFSDLYRSADGETSTTLNGQRGMNTPHSCRAYFRTHAATTMGIDLVEGIMRHTGYLNAAYVRMTDEEKERLFHEGEHVLYITRADHRIQVGKLTELEREIETLKAKQAEQNRVKTIANQTYLNNANDPEFVKAVAKAMIELKKK